MARRRDLPRKGRASGSPAVAGTGASPPPAGWRAGFLPGVLLPLAVFLALCGLYLATLAPSVVGGDSGELIASAVTGGVPHPPGYPLFALLARLFSALPLGHSPAWRVNLLSAVSTAAAGGLLAALVRSWTGCATAGLAAAAIFGTSSEAWLHATSAEVFGLNVMFVALALRLWLGIERTRRPGLVVALCCVSGLAMCNHHTFVFVGGPLCARSLWLARRELGAKGMALAIGLGLVALSPYLYLRWASLSPAAVSWGDLGTLDGFLDHVLRRNYGTFTMGHAGKEGAFVEEGTFFPTLWHMLFLAVPRLAWLGGGLAVFGLARPGRDKSDRRLAGWLAGLIFLYVFAFSALSNLSTAQGLYLSVLARFFIAPDALLAVAAGLGFARLVALLRARRPSGFCPAYLPALGVCVLFVLGIAANGQKASQRHNTVLADFVTAAFASLPPNAIVITMGDHLTGSVFYLREVERLRPDTIHLDRELLGIGWYGERKRRLHPDLFLPPGTYGRNGWGIKKLLDGNPGRPVVVIDRLDNWDQSWKDGYKLATNGLVHPLVKSSEFPSFAEWRARDEKAMGRYDVLPALRARDGTWESALGELVLATEAGRAHLALVYSHEQRDDPMAARTALALLEDVIAKGGGDAEMGIAAQPGVRALALAPNIWKDLGITYEILARSNPALLPKVALAYAKFLRNAPADDTDVPAARRYVSTHRAP
ncbi:MAG: DUF2723 domain-containing protein [Polyangia bacterium]